jgi:hypothetical protein
MPDLTLLAYKGFTLTHLSPQRQTVGSQRVLKAIFANTVLRKPTGGSRSWNIARTLGKTSAKAKTSNSTFSLREKNYPYAKNAGAAWQIKSLTGEINTWKISA